MRGLDPDFFVHSGDMIYADGPLKAEVDLPGGGTWKNLVTEEKSKVAETIEEFRGNYRYNMSDEHVRRFNAQVPQYVQWDDHEVTNNWFHERVIEDPRYTVKSAGAPGGPGEAGHVRVHAPRRPSGGERPGLPAHQPGPEPRPLHDRHAELPRAERREPGDHAQRRRAHPRPRAERVAEAGAARVTGHLEGDRGRHADRAGRLPRLRRRSGAPRRSPRATVPRRGASSRSPISSGSSSTTTCGTSCGSRPTSTTAPPISTSPAAPSSPTSSPSTSSSPARSTRAGSARTSSTTPSGPAWSSRSIPPGPRQYAAPTEGGLYFGHVRIDGKTGVMTVSHRDLTGTVLHSIDLSPRLGARQQRCLRPWRAGGIAAAVHSDGRSRHGGSRPMPDALRRRSHPARRV